MTDAARRTEATQALKFYQKDTFAAGNRLVGETDRMAQASTGRTDAIVGGHGAGPGCGEALAARHVIRAAMQATNDNLIVVNATGGLEEFSAPYTESAWQAAWVHSLFGNAVAVASGVAAAVLRIKGRNEMHVLAQVGDDSTNSFGWLSAMFERNDDVLIVDYDSEGHANGCVQRSSAPQPAASETVGEEAGNLFDAGRSVCRIAIARGIPYAASASVADLRDLERKVTKAMSLHGARYLHVHAPCPLGWGAASRDTIRLARLAVESGIFPLFEAEHGAITGSRKIRHRVPVGEYLKPQKRYAHLFKMDNQPDIVRLQEMADRNIAEFDLLSSEENS